MKTCRTALSVPLSLLVISCGGGGDGNSSVTLPGNDDSVFGEACQNDYYREIIGTYKGTVTYDYSTETEPSLERCEWSMTARIEPDSDTFACSLRIDIESTVDQDVVLETGDQRAYQCMEENSVRSLYDPNQSSDPNSFDSVNFPVFMGIESDPSIPVRGPYFGDPSAQAEYYHLFDGLAWLADGVRLDGEGGLELFESSPSQPQVLTGILEKE